MVRWDSEDSWYSIPDVAMTGMEQGEKGTYNILGEDMAGQGLTRNTLRVVAPLVATQFLTSLRVWVASPQFGIWLLCWLSLCVCFFKMEPYCQLRERSKMAQMHTETPSHCNDAFPHCLPNLRNDFPGRLYRRCARTTLG